MSMFENPFLLYLGSDAGSSHHDLRVHDPMHHASISTQQFGNQTLLRDQLGHHLGAIQHFTNDIDLVKDATGNIESTIRRFGNQTVMSDNLGHAKMTGHQFGDHLLVQDAHSQYIADIHPFANTTVATDPLGHTQWTATDY